MGIERVKKLLEESREPEVNYHLLSECFKAFSEPDDVWNCDKHGFSGVGSSCPSCVYENEKIASLANTHNNDPQPFKIGDTVQIPFKIERITQDLKEETYSLVAYYKQGTSNGKATFSSLTKDELTKLCGGQNEDKRG